MNVRKGIRIALILIAALFSLFGCENSNVPADAEISQTETNAPMSEASTSEAEMEATEPPLTISIDRGLSAKARFNEEETEWFVLDEQYDYVSDSAYGMVIVGQEQPADEEMGEAEDLFGLLDSKGNEILGCEYWSIRIIAQDIVLASRGEERIGYTDEWFNNSVKG